MRVLLKRRLAQRDQRGAVALIVGLLSLLLLGISAFTVDFGMAYATKRQLSTASDSAALAADMVYKSQYKGLCTTGNDPNNPSVVNANVRNDAEDAADSLFVQNYPAGTRDDGTITELACKGTGVEVTYSATGKSGSPFGGLLGGSGTITTAGAAAAAYNVGGGICALCVLGNVKTNNTDFTVQGGDIYVNGDVDVNPQSYWTANTSITIAGTVSGLSQSKATPDWTSGPPITDPFAEVTLPASPWAGLAKHPGGNPCLLGPGVYTSYNIGNATCTLSGGAYVFTGGLTFQSTNSKLTSNGQPVSLFFASSGGYLDVKNGHIYNMPAPSLPLPTGFPSGWPAGFVIMYDRNNTNAMSLQGNGDSPGLKGSIYALKSTVEFNGTSCFQDDSGAVVIGAVNTNGNSCLQVTNAKNAGNALPENLRLTQ